MEELVDELYDLKNCVLRIKKLLVIPIYDSNLTMKNSAEFVTFTLDGMKSAKVELHST